MVKLKPPPPACSQMGQGPIFPPLVFVILGCSNHTDVYSSV